MPEPTYACTCGATGSAATTTKTDAAAPDAKHHKACGGVTITGYDAAALGRIVERVREAVVGS